MTTTDGSKPARNGLVRSLNAALCAGLVCGALFGLIDGVVAAIVGTAELSFLALLGCLSGAILEYALAWSVALIIAGLVLHPMLMRKPDGERLIALVRIGLMLGLFIEFYWWTRTFVFYGKAAASFERLGATLVILVIAGIAASLLARRSVPILRRALRPAIVCIGVAMLAGFLFLRAQEGALGTRGNPNARNRGLPNVMLVVVDALRQDTLGCYGHPRVKSPHIDRLAREGVLFENAFTQAPFTWTSFGSLLTAKYPRRHGLVKMAADRDMALNITLPYHLKSASFTTDSAQNESRLQDGDYLGVTFHTGTLSSGSHLLRGFDIYYEQLAGHDLVVADSSWSVFRSDLLLHVFKQKLAQRAGGDTAGVAREWIQENGSKRFVSMVHLYSTHTPYDPAPEFKRMYADPSYTGPVKSFYSGDRELIESGRATPSPADVEAIQNLYYAGVSEADAKIGALIGALERQGILDNTVVIVTADHGESLGEPSVIEHFPAWEHDHMEQTNLRVPLVMRWPKHLPAGRRVTAITDEIDVVPTVCDLLGLVPPSEPGEYGRIDGTSLMPLVRGEQDSVRELSFAENGFFLSAQDRRWKLVVPGTLLSEKGWKKGESEEGYKPVLFDLESDPSETTDELASNPNEVARLLAALRAWSASMPIPKSDVVLSARELEAIRRKLNGMGYTEGGMGSGMRRAPKTPNKP